MKKKQESRSQETRKQEEHEMKGAKAVRTKAGVNRQKSEIEAGEVA